MISFVGEMTCSLIDCAFLQQLQAFDWLGIIILMAIKTNICQRQQNNSNINFNKKTTLRSKFKSLKLSDLNLGLNVLQVSSSSVMKVKLSKDILASAYYCFRLCINVLSKFVSSVVNPRGHLKIFNCKF
jgi:hypothetical protein